MDGRGVKIALMVVLTIAIPAVLTPAVSAQSCQQDGAGAKPPDRTPSPKYQWSFEEIAELAAQGLIEDPRARERARTRYLTTMLGARPGTDAVAGEMLDLLLTSPDAVDTNGDGKKDTWVSKVGVRRFGVTDIDGNGRVDYIWDDKNGDGIPQPSELQKLDRDCVKVHPIPIDPQRPVPNPHPPGKEPTEKGTHESGR